MKDKITAGLKTKYTNMGFTDKDFEGVATFLVASTTDESQIDNVVNGAEPLLKTFQGYADGRVQRLKTENEELKKKIPAEEEKKESSTDVPAGATETEKALLATLSKISEGFNSLTQRVNNMESGATSQTRQQKIEAALEKALPTYKANVLELFEAKTEANKFKTEADFDAFLAEKVAGISVDTKSVNEENLKALPKASISIAGKDGKALSNFGEMMRSARENKEAAETAKN